MPSIASAEFSAKMGDQFSHRVEGRREANPFIDGYKRYCLDETLVLFSPERVVFDLFQHAGEQSSGFGGGNGVPSPAPVGCQCRKHEPREFRRRRCTGPEGGEVVQMANDGWIVAIATTPARVHAPRERAQLVGRRFDRIDAAEGQNLGGQILYLI